jgi:hypothetical protein
MSRAGHHPPTLLYAALEAQIATGIAGGEPQVRRRLTEGAITGFGRRRCDVLRYGLAGNREFGVEEHHGLGWLENVMHTIHAEDPATKEGSVFEP